MGRIGAVVILLLAAVAAFGPAIAPYTAYEVVVGADWIPANLQPPSADHWLGTTATANDVFSQLLIGSRVAFVVGLSAAAIAVVVSMVIGIVSGYFGGRVDDILMRITDVALCIPTLPFALVFVAMFGPSLTNIVIVIALLFWRNGARIVRSVVLSEKEKVFVKAAKAGGASHLYVIGVHILPSILPVGLLWMTMSVAFAVMTEASLSFLGLGDPNTVSWGQMLNAAFSSGEMRHAWWWVIPPAMALALLITSLYAVGRIFEEDNTVTKRRTK